jgi:hypothetical protein
MSWEPHLKIVEVMSKSGLYVIMIPVYNFNTSRALKKLFSAGVEVTSTNSDTQKDLLM